MIYVLVVFGFVLLALFTYNCVLHAEGLAASADRDTLQGRIDAAIEYIEKSREHTQPHLRTADPRHAAKILKGESES